MHFDLLGRLDNLRLPDGRDAIYMAVFEAVSNAKHAIEDKFTDASSDSGQITVDLLRSEDTGHTDAIKVIDNGVGLTAANL
ncbi:MAG: ATP-binding protein, partial [Tagaea sp.]